MKALLFPGDQQFWYETLRALGHTAYGGADIGEVVTTAQRITAGDYGSWYAQWAATAQRTEAEARAQLAAGHQVSARDGLLRAATYWRSAEFFTRDRDPDPRGRPAYAAYLVQTKAPQGPWFEVAVIHHTDCGSALLADDDLRHGYAQRIGVDERALADTPVLDPARTVRTDVQRVLWAPQIPPHVQVSGHVYDVETALVTTVVDAKASRQPA